MNIFYLHNDTKLCAEQHVDKHVVKMIVEYAQLLSTAHRMIDGVQYAAKSKTGRNVKRFRLENNNLDNIVYKAVHYHHPSAVWARETKMQYLWLYDLFKKLGQEYTHRYGKRHKSQAVIEWCIINLPNIPEVGYMTEQPKAMPDECKTDDVVEKDDKRSSFKGRKKFKKRQRPKKFSFKKHKKK